MHLMVAFNTVPVSMAPRKKKIHALNHFQEQWMFVPSNPQILPQNRSASSVFLVMDVWVLVTFFHSLPKLPAKLT